jgi:hypothetical protein
MGAYPDYNAIAGEHMRDAETQKALERIADRTSWSVGWLICILVSLEVFIKMARMWHAFDSAEKFTAGCLTLLLILFPVRVLFLKKQGRTVPGGLLFVMGYVLLMFTLMTFGAFH